MSTWYFKNSDQEFGPYNDQELRNEVNGGRITPDTMIRQNEIGNWF